MDTRELLQVSVKEIMNKDIISVRADTSVEEIDKIFNERKIHHIPVLNKEGEILGIISSSDLLLLKDWGTKFGLKNALRKNELLMKSQLALDLMSAKVVTVHPDSSLEKCVDIFKENLFRCLPVVENNKIVGLVTTFDLLNIAFKKSPLLN